MGETLLVVLFKKITELVGEKLFASLTSRKIKHRDALLSLFASFKLLDPLIEVLMVRLSNREDGSDKDQTRLRRQLDDAVRDIRSVLEQIEIDLSVLAPDFEIMAQDTAAVLSDFMIQDGSMLSYILSANGDADPQVKAKLKESRSEAFIAREALRTFISRVYDWQTIHED